MSLTSQIRNVDNQESRFFRKEFPNVPSVGRQWRQHLAAAETIRPPQTPKPVPWTVIGQALDYRGDVLINEHKSSPVAGPAYDFCLSLEQLLQEAQPAGRRLPPDVEASLCRHCYVLALFEHIYREGWEYESPLYGVTPKAPRRMSWRWPTPGG